MSVAILTSPLASAYLGSFQMFPQSGHIQAPFRYAQGQSGQPWVVEAICDENFGLLLSDNCTRYAEVRQGHEAPCLFVPEPLASTAGQWSVAGVSNLRKIIFSGPNNLTIETAYSRQPLTLIQKVPGYSSLNMSVSRQRKGLPNNERGDIVPHYSLRFEGAGVASVRRFFNLDVQASLGDIFSQCARELNKVTPALLPSILPTTLETEHLSITADINLQNGAALGLTTYFDITVGEETLIITYDPRAIQAPLLPGLQRFWDLALEIQTAASKLSHKARQQEQYDYQSNIAPRYQEITLSDFQIDDDGNIETSKDFDERVIRALSPSQLRAEDIGPLH